MHDLSRLLVNMAAQVLVDPKIRVIENVSCNQVSHKIKILPILQEYSNVFWISSLHHRPQFNLFWTDWDTSDISIWFYTFFLLVSIWSQPQCTLTTNSFIQSSQASSDDSRLYLICVPWWKISVNRTKRNIIKWIKAEVQQLCSTMGGRVSIKNMGTL